MIAGHREHRQAALLEPVDELARQLIFGDLGALGEIAADRDQIGPLAQQQLFERGDDDGIVASEMDVGKMRDTGQNRLLGLSAGSRI